MALYFECPINKNALLYTGFFLVTFSTGIWMFLGAIKIMNITLRNRFFEYLL